jgi:hypothetical protein
MVVHSYFLVVNHNTTTVSHREDPTEEQRPTMLTKRVSWVDGINSGKSAHIAISIPRHKHIKVCNF